MLRIETSNLASARPGQRSRRLYPTVGSVERRSTPWPPAADPPTLPRTMPPPPAVREGGRFAASCEHDPDDTELTLRQELPPPALVPGLRPNSVSAPASGRWSVQLELEGEQLASLYGHGLAESALVRRRGMLDWQPLLRTPELQPLLRRTRVITDPARPDLGAASAGGSIPDWEDTPVFPSLARRPSTRLEPSSHDRRAPAAHNPPSLAPSAGDVAPRRHARHAFELLTVAALAAALTWFARPMAWPSPIATGTQAAASGLYARPEVAQQKAPTPLPAPTPAVSVESSAPTLRAVSAPAAPSAIPAPAVGDRSRALGPSRSELVAALGQVARAAGSCGERASPVRVLVSFANSGVVRSIRVSGADLAAPTRSCIIAAAARARISAFAGEPVTVAKTL